MFFSSVNFIDFDYVEHGKFSRQYKFLITQLRHVRRKIRNRIDRLGSSVSNTVYLSRFSSETWKSRVTIQNNSRVCGQFAISRKIIWVFNIIIIVLCENKQLLKHNFNFIGYSKQNTNDIS